MTRKSHSRSATHLPLICLLFVALVAAASAEWKEKVLYSFQGLPDGEYPAGGVVFDKAGNLYGTTRWGGANDCAGMVECGIVYQLQPPLQKGKAWREQVLYVFKGVKHSDGNTPEGGVLLDQAGNLYGTTAYGGNGKCQAFGSRSGCGTVFELIPPKQNNGVWTEKVLYSFQGNQDGQLPSGELTFDSAGNLYGATVYGGRFGKCNDPLYHHCGTVFRLSPPKTKGGHWTEKILYAFKSGNDGANPNGGLLLDKKGAIYGTTFYGANTGCGADNGTGCGTVFKLTPTKSGGWKEQLLIQFKSDASMGGHPAAGLIFGANGDLYGTTSWGGHDPINDGGTVFNLRRGKDGRWHESLLRSFTGDGPDGSELLGRVVIDAAGNLYGTASIGGNSFDGTAFKLAPPIGGRKKWVFNVICQFGKFPDAASPESNLIFDDAGDVFGTSLYGGAGFACQGHCGTVFQLQP
jgi:hypothetical protein